ncbi:MAG TPA: transposase [Agriterribacter sp.]|nr:transposase [Agriterribacter sp.]
MDVFTRDLYRNILLDSFRYCQKNQGLQMCAWVLMTNHFHLIYSCTAKNDPAMVLKNIKSCRALKMIDKIIKNPQESREEWMLRAFRQYGRENKSDHEYQFWQHENHPILRDSAEMLEQRMSYLDENFVHAGFVESVEHWKFSIAVDYYTINKKGLLEIVSVH